jgi:hypothetical protein
LYRNLHNSGHPGWRKAAGWAVRGSNPSSCNIFSFIQNAQICSRAQFSGHRGFPGVKRPGHDVEPLSPSVASVTNEWRCTAAPPVRLRNMNSDSLQFLTFYKSRYFVVKTESQLHVSAHIGISKLYICVCVCIYVYKEKRVNNMC